MYKSEVSIGQERFHAGRREELRSRQTCVNKFILLPSRLAGAGCRYAFLCLPSQPSLNRRVFSTFGHFVHAPMVLFTNRLAGYSRRHVNRPVSSPGPTRRILTSDTRLPPRLKTRRPVSHACFEFTSMEMSGAKDGRRTEEGWTKGTFPFESPLSLCYPSSRFCVVSFTLCAAGRPESWAGGVHVFATGSLPGQDGVSAWDGRPEVRLDLLIVSLLTSCSEIENTPFFVCHLFVNSLGHVSEVRQSGQSR